MLHKFGTRIRLWTLKSLKGPRDLLHWGFAVRIGLQWLAGNLSSISPLDCMDEDSQIMSPLQDHNIILWAIRLWDGTNYTEQSVIVVTEVTRYRYKFCLLRHPTLLLIYVFSYMFMAIHVYPVAVIMASEILL